jgi:hypothetical protein
MHRKHPYNLARKKEFVSRLQHLIQHQLAEDIHVSQSTVSRMMRSVVRWGDSPTKSSINPSKKTLGLGRPRKYVEIEAWLMRTFTERRELKQAVTPTLLSILVLQVYPTFQNGDPVATRRSIYRWMDYAKLSVRRVTHHAATDEAAMGEQLLEVVESFRDRRAIEDIPLPLCFNMDETAVDLRESFRTTIAHRGERAVAVRAPKGCPKRVTVLLAVGFGGAFLRPLVVFAAKRGERWSGRCPPWMVHACTPSRKRGGATRTSWTSGWRRSSTRTLKLSVELGPPR